MINFFNTITAKLNEMYNVEREMSIEEDTKTADKTYRIRDAFTYSDEEEDDDYPEFTDYGRISQMVDEVASQHNCNAMVLGAEKGYFTVVVNK